MNDTTNSAQPDELFAGELPNSEEMGGLGVEMATEDIAGKTFDPASIKIVTLSTTFGALVQDFQNDGIEHEEWRTNRSWSIDIKSRFVESLLLRLPIPAFYAVEDAKGVSKIVDGTERFDAIGEFLNGKFALHGLEFLTQLQDLPFADLPRQMQRRIEEAPVQFYIIKNDTPADAMFAILKRINATGQLRSVQEIRLTLFEGIACSLLFELADSPPFKLLFGSTNTHDELIRQELVLRFFAFYLASWQEYIATPLGMDAFLNQTMRQLNKKTIPELNAMKRHFITIMETASALFGEHSFRRSIGTNGQKTPINPALFEALGVGLAHLSDEKLKSLLARKELLIQSIRQLLNNKNFQAAISQATWSAQHVEIRFREIEKTIAEVLQ